MKLYAAIINIPGRASQRIVIRATDAFVAKAMLEGQYGRGNVRDVHTATARDEALASGRA